MGRETIAPASAGREASLEVRPVSSFPSQGPNGATILITELEKAIEKEKENRKKNIKRKRIQTIKLTHQNIQGTNADWKQKFIEAACNTNETQIITLTETNSTEKSLRSIRHICKNYKLIPCAEKGAAKGQGVIILVQYPLARAITKI